MKDYDQICGEIAEGKYSPIYFLSGDEPYFIDRISQLIEKTALEPSQKDFNQVILYGRESKMADVLNHARKFPVMSDRQVIIVRESQEMMDWRSGDRVKDLLFLFGKYCSLNNSSVLPQVQNPSGEKPFEKANSKGRSIA